MKREKKVFLLKSIQSIFQSFSCIVIVNLHGLNSSEMIALRGRLWDQKSDLKVVKNSLLKIALCDSGFANLSSKLTEGLAVFYSDDLISLCKLIYAFMNTDGKIRLVSMIYNQSILPDDQFEKIAKLPSVEELRLKLLGVLNFSASNCLSLFSYPANLMRGLLDVRVKNN